MEKSGKKAVELELELEQELEPVLEPVPEQVLELGPELGLAAERPRKQADCTQEALVAVEQQWLLAQVPPREEQEQKSW
jgi:hypothetical protein